MESRPSKRPRKAVSPRLPKFDTKFYEQLAAFTGECTMVEERPIAFLAMPGTPKRDEPDASMDETHDDTAEQLLEVDHVGLPRPSQT